MLRQNRSHALAQAAEKNRAAVRDSNSVDANVPIIELCHVSKSFATGGGPQVTILDDINLEVREGEMLALLGQSGSGKSTILRLMAGLVDPSAGQVLCRGRSFEGINPSLSMVFQSFALYPWLTVYENVQIGLVNQKLSPEQEQSEIEQALDLIGLSGYENAFPKELSGGMRQRVGIARAIVAKPSVLCMDEAFSALDVFTAENLRTEVVKLWLERRADLKSIFFVTHNIPEAVFMATRIVIISSHPGRVRREIINPLPYPRDVNSKEFHALVDEIHDAITTLALPDEPVGIVVGGEEESRETLEGAVAEVESDSDLESKDEEVRKGDELPKEVAPKGVPAKKTMASRPPRVQSIPEVTVGRIVGLLEIIEDSQETVDIFDLSAEIGEDFGQTIAIVKAAEMLELVETPKHDVHLTELGRQFLAADQGERKDIFATQIRRLRLFHLILDSLEKSEDGRIDADIILEELAILLPYDRPDKLFGTIIAWGRYAELIDFDQDENCVFLPTQGE